MKKILLPMIVLVAGVAFSSFTVRPQKVSTLQEAWFVYDMGSKTSQDSYHYSATNPGCESDVALCAVFAVVDESTIQDEDITTSKPLESGENIRSLQQLDDDSEGFTEPTSDVEFRNE